MKTNTQQDNFTKDEKMHHIKYERLVLEAMSDIILDDGYIPQSGKAINDKAEMLRIFMNFNYRHSNDGDDTFFSNFRTEELINTRVCSDAPNIVKIFFEDARKAYNRRGDYFSIIELLENEEEYNEAAIEAVNKKENISYERMDEVSNSIVPWVFYSLYPSTINDEEILNLSKDIMIKKRILWEKRLKEENDDYEASNSNPQTVAN